MEMDEDCGFESRVRVRLVAGWADDDGVVMTGWWWWVVMKSGRDNCSPDICRISALIPNSAIVWFRLWYQICQSPGSSIGKYRPISQGINQIQWWIRPPWRAHDSGNTMIRVEERNLIDTTQRDSWSIVVSMNYNEDDHPYIGVVSAFCNLDARTFLNNKGKLNHSLA